MAVMPRPQAAGANTTIKIALVAFVAISVVSLAVTIFLYTHQSDLRSRASEVEEQARRSDQHARDAERQLEEFARIVIGKPTADIPEIKDAILPVVQRVAEDPNLQEAHITQDLAVLTVLETLHTVFSEKVDELGQAIARVKELDDQRAREEESLAASRKQFSDTVKQLQIDYQTIEQQSAENRTAWSRQVDKLSSELETASESASNQLTQEREQHRLTK